MINRVLIRIKVVQLLYSYLLVDNQFSLASQPSAPTKEKRFAYSLYLDVLVFMTRIAAYIERRGGEKPLEDTRFIRRILSDDRIKSLQAKYRLSEFPFAAVEDKLSEIIKESGLYKNFLKSDDRSSAAGEGIWKEIFERFIISNPEVNAIISRRENYTLKGVDRMRDMMDETFTQFFASADHLPDALKVLSRSLDQARELYFRLLILPIALTELREKEIEDARHKYVKTEEDINPNMRLVENEYIQSLREDPVITEYVDKRKLSWCPEDETTLRSLLRAIMNSDLYKDYLEFPATDYNTDAEFWRNVYKHIIFINPDFLECLEDKSVFWNDDLDFIGTFVLKTVKRFEQYVAMSPEAQLRTPDPVLPMYKDEEDARFGADLFSDVIRNKDKYRQIIDDVLDRSIWETERLAYMDVVITMAALAEILNFPKIPLRVSVNEYIEIAKYYSTPKSGTFVNGLLRSLVEKLREENKLHKEFVK